MRKETDLRTMVVELSKQLGKAPNLDAISVVDFKAFEMENDVSFFLTSIVHKKKWRGLVSMLLLLLSG